eukprot:CAMPEP_0115184334 /NCGR_PEP_ID=MMETSP0270-20121206/8910_1 /TAXON_ID=71861 /ORGANISM="Scrippsiella trochoidea, Strain CCMP3099" /LENGTH=409 /DNA_ID=CAMNT_0002597419 /DNA_START=17 /DNA_END=1243 /DNA_ORIENTATION=-
MTLTTPHAGGPDQTKTPSMGGSMSKAMIKMQMQRELAAQKTAELKAGEEWNEKFRIKDNLKNAEVLSGFWAEVKIRLTKKFGGIHAAFRKLDSSGDGSISFLEFCDMLQMINLPMDQRILRQLFDKASGGDRALSMEELKTLLLDKTIRKLRFVMEGFNSKQERVQTHIHRFIRRLAHTEDVSRTRSIDRFQRKLTVDFVKELWQSLQKHPSLKDSAGDGRLERSACSEVMESFVAKEVGTRLLAYEVLFMERIFDRADRRRRGSVALTEFLCMLLLLSPDIDRLAKAALIFDFFDSDSDGCLLYEQIMTMFLCICSQRPMAEENLRHVYDLDFQEELSAQEGQHAYELALWHLQQTSKVEGGIVTKRELVEALERMPDLLDALLPGAVRMRWALQPSYVEGPDPPSPA